MRVLVVCRDLLYGKRYGDALELVGIQPVLSEPEPGLTIGTYEGLLLTGGTDVNPELYNEIRAPETDAPDRERDTAEAALIGEALQRDVPLFAICRGMQMLNVHLGGKLIQHLATTDRHRRKTEDRGIPAHTVEIVPDTLLSKIAGKREWRVNSRHHQAVGQLAPRLTVAATDPGDGVIEAVELPDRRFVLGVQWHPEDQAAGDFDQRELFAAFRNAL